MTVHPCHPTTLRPSSISISVAAILGSPSRNHVACDTSGPSHPSPDDPEGIKRMRSFNCCAIAYWRMRPVDPAGIARPTLRSGHTSTPYGTTRYGVITADAPARSLPALRGDKGLEARQRKLQPCNSRTRTHVRIRPAPRPVPDRTSGSPTCSSEQSPRHRSSVFGSEACRSDRGNSHPAVWRNVHGLWIVSDDETNAAPGVR